ncbi:hypothetical protein M433DRAFT_252034 [Acidomyces richmondensis BFW]|nr:MAG: hypothetical protein FE78DRAFT_423285 [Acidomyces sp. 'richmondensis']KYG49780.1 hypothetical protein M433DRAFT_252034 [Acidomyces richmondensis BFW]
MADFGPKTLVDSSKPLDVSSLAGKSVVVTGGAMGIGEAMVRAFVSAGAFVTFGDINKTVAQQLVANLGGGINACYVPCDVTVWSDQLSLFKTALIESPSKSIDIVVANAGIAVTDDVFHQLPLESTEDPKEPQLKTLRTNLIGVAYTVKLAGHYLPRQSKKQDRSLIMVASLAGYLDQPGEPQYCASKWGVRGLMHSLRPTSPPQGFRVNIIAPWFIATNIVSEGMRKQLEEAGLQFAAAEDAAKATLRFASDASLNGRSVAIVPRDENPNGYFDLELDDLDEYSALGKMMKKFLALRVKMQPK